MDEFIERNALVNNLELLARHEDRFTQSVILGVVGTIRAIKAADVAPVVRCMDCKHLVSVNVNGKGIPTCRVSGMEVAPDEFCSRGEKGRR